ncbi:ctf-4 [Pristionchus pacificus]|uniref:Minichromosome loss protein Mcl1 middle region domain-containing protein n=1 Tax=Pristionchus pacificus TaxID=54126 RepID=A0A8R1UB83_PRIPA|nr:ctf-4 [Pristionchus pacificus]
MKFAPSKQIHSRGALSIAHNVQSTDEKVVSCGVDGVIGVWDKSALSSDGSPKIREISDRTHSCCALYDNQVYAGFTQTDLSTGVEKQVVGSFGMDEEDAVKTIMSFSLDVTSVKVSKDWVIAGSSDFSVKRAERADDDMSAGYNRYELNAQVLDIQIHPSEKMFAVSSCDGFVSLFDGDDTEPVYSHKLFSPIRDLDDSFPRVLMSWSVDGKLLFVPCKGMVKVVSKKGDKWNVERDFKHDDEKEDDFSVVTTSPCGKYVVASTMASLVHIWEIESGLLVSTADYGNERAGRITGLTYLGEKSKKLIVADSHGNIATLEELGPSKEKKQEKKSNVFIDDEAMQEDSFDANDKDDEEEEEEEEIVVSKNKKFTVEDDEMDEDTRMSSSIAAIKKKYGYDDDGERMNEGEGNSFDEDPFSNIDAHPGSSMKRMDKNDKVAPVRVVEKYSPPTPPPYFSSASSPRNITQRYIKWNGFGTIRVLESEDGESSLEIRFHDSSVHSEMLLSNTDINYSMGDVNDTVVALATKLKGASKHLYVKLLNSWDSNDDHWEIQLTKGELPDDVVVSSEFVALLCENRNIRVFTHAGSQRHVITHPTPILTLSSFSDRLAVVSIGGGPIFFSHKDETNYEFPLVLNEYRLSALSQWWSCSAMSGPSSSIRDQPLALSKGTELTWIGYTNRGRIVAQGSDSIIRLLVSPPYSPSFWTPIFDGSDTLTSPSDFIWPVSVVEKPVSQLRYVYCRGVKYPMATLKLNPIIANWSIPLCNKTSDKSCLEEELFLNELAMSAANETEIKDLSSNHLKTIIKLFSLAIKGDRESRAVEMANLTSSSKGVQLLVNWAAKQRRNALVEKVSEVGRRKAEEEEETLNRQLGYGGWEEKEKMEDRGNRVVRKKVPLRRSIAASSANKYKIEEEKDDSAQSVDEPPSEIGSQGVFNLDTSTSIPARNPFKRSLDESVADTSSTSVFDDLDSPAPMRKKLKETQNTVPAPITQKQAKLSFGSNKKSSGYDLWLAENEERLKGDFIGDEEDFIKYCTQAYRMLTGAERKEWRMKAEC